MDKLRKDVPIELTIDDLGFEGKGIGRYESFVVFVPNTVPGDRVRVKIKKIKKNYAEASLEEIIQQSAFRVKPECVYFGTCNGCKMQNIDYKIQLQLKRQNVHNAFTKIGGFEGLAVPEVIGSNPVYFYRNKLEFSFSNNRWLTEADMINQDADKSFALGYHMPGFIDKVLDIKSCCLQSEASNKILNLTRDFFKKRNCSIYSTKTHTGYLRFLTIRQAANTPDLMVNLITYNENPPLIKEYAEELKQNIPAVTTLVNSISQSKAQVATAQNYDVVFGKGYIEEFVGKYKFKITPNAFFQTNSRQCLTLFETLLKLGEFSKKETILDLYCGTGAISLFISGYADKVHGVELSDESIAMAKENAELNSVANCTFEAKDVRDFLQEISVSDTVRYETIILDPPRSGIHPDAAKYLLQYKPKKILYVSCNPATQARDIRMLAESYKISAIQPVDMFPHTFHIENVVRLDLI